MPDNYPAPDRAGASARKSIFERQKEEAEAKRIREQAETAAVLEDFVKSFENDADRPASTPTRAAFTGPGKRHFTSSGLKSGPGSLGPSPAARSGPGSLGPAFNRKRPYDDYNDRRGRGEATLTHGGDRRTAPIGDQETEDIAAAKPTIHLSSLPHGTSPAVVKSLFHGSLVNVEHVRIVPPQTTYGPNTGRKSSAAIVTLAAETPAADIDTAVSRLQNRYLGFGFNLSISRGLSTAAIANTNVSSSLTNELPFGARAAVQQHSLSRAPPPDHRFAPPSSYTPGSSYGRHATHVNVHIPADLKQLKLIHKMVEALLTYGPEFEALLMSRLEVQQDEKWSWLWNSRSAGGVYYRWRIWETLTDAKSRRKHGRYASQVLFDGGESVWVPPEDSLRFEYVTRIEEFVSDEDYNSSDEEDDGGGDKHGIAQRYNDHNGQVAATPLDDSQDGMGYLNPLSRSKLIHLLTRLPDSSAKLRRGDVARVTAFAIEHAGAGAEEIAALITRNVVRPFSPSEEGEDSDRTSASQVGLYIISDILSSSASAGVRHAWRYRTLFEHALRQQRTWEQLGRAEKTHAWGKLKAEKWKRSIQSLLTLWEGWSVFPQASHEEFTAKFMSPPLTEQEKLAIAKAEEARKRDGEDEARRVKSVNRWKTVDEDTEGDAYDADMQDMDGAAMMDDDHSQADGDGHVYDHPDENIDGTPMDDSSDEDIGATIPIPASDTTVDVAPHPPPPPPPPASTSSDPLENPKQASPSVTSTATATNVASTSNNTHVGRKQRPRAADMFADASD